MSENRSPVAYDDNFFKGLIRQLKLAWRLFLDPRVHWLTKSLPVMATLYVISPVDLIPNAVAPILGGMDDLAVAILGLKLFIEFSPPEVVREHLRQLIEGGGWQVVNDPQSGGGQFSGSETTVVEGEYRVLEETGDQAQNR